MTIRQRIWIVLGALFILLGGGIFVFSMSALEWDFSALSTAKFDTEIYDFRESIADMKITADTANVFFSPWEEDFIRVECFQDQKRTFDVKAEEQTLLVDIVDQRKWNDYIGISFHTPKITVYLPKGEYGHLAIISDTGDISIEDFGFEKIDLAVSTGDVKCMASARENIRIKSMTGDIWVHGSEGVSLDISASTGNVSLQDVKISGKISVEVSTGKCIFSSIYCKELTSQGDTSKMTLKEVLAEKRLQIETSTGDVVLERCDAPQIKIVTDTGDISGTFASGKTFYTQTDTGTVSVPENEEGGTCTLITDTGDIRLEIAE